MRKSQIAAQLYSFRDFIKTPEGVADTFRILHEMGYGAVQLSSSLAKMPEEELCTKAEGFAIRQNGRSPRTAKHFVETQLAKL